MVEIPGKLWWYKCNMSNKVCSGWEPEREPAITWLGETFILFEDIWEGDWRRGSSEYKTISE